ncbi:hypothetical protein F5X68DRAFT_161634 [Plectosphaerella plurivora]|uniref:non-specific serine/threonine protein kinase n=1 Tax=Plectosphaerella plurivora TaxID=936078 RepID=A0A9P9A525_9PEZI|nr:hypothetical protein F5X68DRAFT_161634 [Plectosphaerella plurivora]
MTAITNVEQLARSIDASSTYPQNLVRSDEFPYALSRYRAEIEELQNRIFKSSDGAIIIWDLDSDNGAGHKYTENPVKGLSELNGLLGTSKPDPFKRFFFLRSRSSRSPLECSKRQMETILSCHQVMAPFLNHVISFQKREEPHRFASFTNEDYLGSQHQLPGLASLNRSGIQLQQCFNVLAMEFDEYDAPQWKQRQVAAHHSFDLQNGRSTWIVMKGDNTIRDRMQEATEKSLKQYPDFPISLAESLRESLRDHMILLQWGTENWSQYITSLEVEYQKLSIVTDFEKIDILADDIFPRRVKARASTLTKAAVALPKTPESLPQISEKAATLASEKSSPPPSPSVPSPGVFRRISSRFTTNSTFPLLGRYSSRMTVDTAEVKNENLDLAELVKFQGPQELNRLAKDVLTASSVIDQNKRVFSDIRARYQELMESPLFSMHVSDENMRRLCEGHAADFIRKVRRLESDLESHQARLNTILYRTQQASEMYNRLFQVVNTRTAEYFAIASQNSTELMQEWTEQMHQKTMSMHIITIFTLIFLPGTFVATMFSSGILTFGQEGEGGFGPWMGDWKVRPAGLKLFFAICVPLLFMTLCAWTVAYSALRRTARQSDDTHDTLLFHRRQGYIRFHCAPHASVTPPRIGATRAMTTDGVSLTTLSEGLHNLSHKYTGRNALGSNSEHFIPLRELQRFWDDKTIQHVIGFSADYKGSIVLRANAIKTQFLRIYSLLVFLERPEKIELFTSWDLNDEVFPLEKFPAQWAETPPNKDLFTLIYEYQWAYFPVIFEEDRLYSQVLPERMILPILHEEIIREGTDDVVLFRTSLEGSSTFAKPEDEKVKVVRKQYLGMKRKSMFERERKAFETLQSRPCKHIVECYGSFGQKHPKNERSYSLILEHFGAGNLDEFFQKASPPRNKSQVIHFWRSFRGLFAALDTIHHSEVGSRNTTTKYEIVHQDIKPQNILISLSSLDINQLPVLKVIDFGYSFTRLSSQPHSVELGGRPPECSHHGQWKNDRINSITTAADIWSAGCVMSEAAAWVAGGQAGRISYEKARAFEAEQRPAFKDAGHGGCFHDGTDRLKMVDTAHQNIRNKLPSYDDITGEVLTLIDNFMLVPMEKRKQAWDIRELLGKIFDRIAPKESAQAKALVMPSTPPQTRSEPSFETLSSPELLVTKFDESFNESENGTTQQEPSPLPTPPPGPRPELNVDIPSVMHLRPITPPPCSPFTRPDGEPGLSMEEAKKYIKDKKAGRPVDLRVQNVIQQLKDNLDGRDHLFFVDTSLTMVQHRTEVTDTLRVYAYLAKLIDKNGIDAGFSTKSQPRKYSTTTALMDALRKQRWNSAAFENSFGKFIDAVIGNLPSWLQVKKAKQQSIFVLTDGRWGRSDVGACGVEGPILRLIEAMKAKRLDRTHVMIQFIRFGAHHQGIRRLDILDQLGVAQGMDIVDTKYFTYDVWGMFFGAINADVDMEEEEEGSRPVSQQRSPAHGDRPSFTSDRRTSGRLSRHSFGEAMESRIGGV